jgi:lipopolysaccharide export system permease protein
MAALTACILVFGRMSADNEVTAMRASGISLYQVISPAILLGVILTLFCAYLNIDLAPKSKNQFEKQRGKILEKDPLAVLNAGGWTTLGRFQIKVSNRSGSQLTNIIILEWLPNGQLKQQTFASQGHLDIDRESKQATLTLLKAHTHHLERDPGSNDLKDVDIPSEEQVISFDLASLYQNDQQSWKLSNLTLLQLVDRLETAEIEGISQMPIMVEIHKRMAFSFASFAFIILAIPVGIRTSRRETFIGIFVSLILVFAYYLFIILAESLADRNDMRPILLMWTPNILFEILGAYLLHRTVKV